MMTLGIVFVILGTNAVKLSRHTGMDCRYPEPRDGKPQYVHVIWIPAFRAGMTASPT
ncbi:MAG: hypothetical protein ACRERU_14915 [Methylococcales bacterium]